MFIGRVCRQRLTNLAARNPTHSFTGLSLIGHFGALSAVRRFGGKNELSDQQVKTPVQSVGAEKPHETAKPAGAEKPHETAKPAGAEKPHETAKPAGAEKPHETVQPYGGFWFKSAPWSWLRFALQYLAWSKYAPLYSAIAAVLLVYYMQLKGWDSLYALMYSRTNILYYEAYNKKRMQEKLTILLRVHKGRDAEDNAPKLPMTSVMQTVRLVDPERFIVVDGMKGVGKSTTMVQLCLDHMESGHPALYLQFTEPDNGPGDEIVDFVLKHTRKLSVLARRIKRERKRLIIVVDDLHRFMEKDNVKALLPNLWLAVEQGARVIFTASDYRIKSLIKAVKGMRSARFGSTIRVPAPTVKELKEWVLKHAKAQADQKAVPSFDEDLDLYCQVVGVIREIRVHYLFSDQPYSLRKVTQTAFNEAVTVAANCLLEVCTKYDKNEVRALLNELCDNQVARTTIMHRPLVTELQAANMIRPSEDSGKYYEFHSFVTEVAIRAILQTPVTAEHLAQPKTPGVESKGRGTAAILHKLTNNNITFLDDKTIARKALGLS